MKEIIDRYIKYMIEKHNIVAAMVTGSYVTGQMSPKSDVDIFFVWEKEFDSMRGREYFENVEFEYFISPEWKYYDRLRTDKTSMRIYSSALVLLDKNNIMEKIKNTAIEKVKGYSCYLSIENRKDYKFWLQTISSDGEDLFDKGDYDNFSYFTGVNLQNMSNLLCMLNNVLPTYEKYGVKEIEEVDKEYSDKLKVFISAGYNEDVKKQIWIEMCDYLSQKLGDFDITKYESCQKL